MEEILKEILQELKNIHYHLDRLEALYVTVNKIKAVDLHTKEEIKN